MKFDKKDMTRLSRIFFNHPTPVGKEHRATTQTTWQETAKDAGDPGRQAWMNDRMVYIFEKYVLVTVVPVSACAWLQVWTAPGEETTLEKEEAKPKGLADRLNK